MKTLAIIKYQWKNLLRARWIIGYMLIYLILTDTLIRFGGSSAKALLSISNIMLLFIPLISMLYAALYLYQSRPFTELLLAQPLQRNTLYTGLYLGLSLPLSLAFLVGVITPVLYFNLFLVGDATSILLILGLGIILTLLFTALGFTIALAFFDDKIKGLGLTLITWLFLAVLFDGLILMMVYLLGDFPLEKPILAVSMLNPIDLARVLVLLEFDISALMGYTGAVFNKFFGSFWGITVSGAMLSVWIGLSCWSGYHQFLRKDF